MLTLSKEDFEALIDALKFDLEFKKDIRDNFSLDSEGMTLYCGSLHKKIIELEDLTDVLDECRKSEKKPYLIAINPT
jgi:hypothetical protein